MAIEIVDFPIKNGGSFHSFLYVDQAGYPQNIQKKHRFTLHQGSPQTSCIPYMSSSPHARTAGRRQRLSQRLGVRNPAHRRKKVWNSLGFFHGHHISMISMVYDGKYL